jgi:TPR repeat protein
MDKLIFTLLAALALPAAAQGPARTPMSYPAAAERHVEALALQNRGDDKGAFHAFLEAAQDGYPPAQLRVAELYNEGSPAVVRDYAQALYWYEKAREGGEKIPPLPKAPGGAPPSGRGAWH